MVGKLYPTADPGHATPLPTANFMTQDDIGGEETAFINDVPLRNAPNTTLSRRGAGAPTLVATGVTFTLVDKHRRFVSSTRSRNWASPQANRRARRSSCSCSSRREQPRIEGDGLDFRDEVMAQIFDPGDPTPKRSLTFNIELTDEGETTGRRSKSAARSATGGVWGR